MTEPTYAVFRFDDVVVREREFRVTKAGEVIQVEPKAFRVLLFLLRNPERPVTKDELLNAVWSDVAVSENSAARAIAQLRRLLGDDIREPRYIATVATIGYRFVCRVEISEDRGGNPLPADQQCLEKPIEGIQPNPDLAEIASESPALADSASAVEILASEAPQNRRRYQAGWLFAAAGFAVSSAILVWYLHRPLPPPHVSEYLQITHDGHGKVLVGVDRNRLYLNRTAPPYIAEVAISGGEMARIPVALSSPWLRDVSPDKSSLLVTSFDERGLWIADVLAGSLRRVSKSSAGSVVWSPDGQWIASTLDDADVVVMRSDGSGARKLFTAPGPADEDTVGDLAWSPDGTKIRFTRNRQLWEVASDGSNLHRLLPGWHSSSWLCCGHWTPDGAFFLFLSGDNLLLTSHLLLPGSDLWALDERRSWLRQPPIEPVQLTSGSARWSAPIPSPDGKTVYAQSISLHGELVRFDAKSGDFRPYLGGVSAEFVNFSHDARSVVYVSFPESVLWRANLDNGERVRLTDPPLYPRDPHWSPDGTEILFTGLPAQGRLASYVVSSQGGEPRRVLAGDDGEETEANWSPDGRQIVFSWWSCKANDPGVIRILNVKDHSVITVAGSQDMFFPRWSPNGRYIATLSSSQSVAIFDLETKRWLPLPTGDVDSPVWSRDSRFIYYLRWHSRSGISGMYRVPVAGGSIQLVMNMNEVHSTGSLRGVWMGLDPTDAPLLLRDAGTNDVYAFTLDRK